MEDQKNKTQQIVKENANPGFTLADYIKIFLRHKKVIIIFTLSILVLSIILYFFVVKPVYLSTATVKTTTQAGGISGLLSGAGLPDMGDLGDLAGVSGGISAKELAFYETILFSRRCLEPTIIKFNIMEIYDQKYMKGALKFFREEIMEINSDKIGGTLEIGVYDEDPVIAKEIADFLIGQLNKINTELNVLSAKNNREFIESRYHLVKEDLKKAEDSLIIYQNIFGIAPDISVKAAVKTEVELEAEIKSEEVKLDLLRKILSPDQAEVKAQEERINALQKQLFDIQNSTDRSSVLQLKGSPDIVMNFLRLKREVEIQNKILTFIIPMLEQAKIEEKKETPTILILDYPQIPDYKDKPKRLKFVAIWTFLAFFIINAFFIVKFKWTQFKNSSEYLKIKSNQRED
jgi:capsule polysaccharide export protein KpsE/RkpR